jgi:hypothetical protein
MPKWMKWNKKSDLKFRLKFVLYCTHIPLCFLLTFSPSLSSPNPYSSYQPLHLVPSSQLLVTALLDIFSPNWGCCGALNTPRKQWKHQQTLYFTTTKQQTKAKMVPNSGLVIWKQKLFVQKHLFFLLSFHEYVFSTMVLQTQLVSWVSLYLKVMWIG